MIGHCDFIILYPLQWNGMALGGYRFSFERQLRRLETHPPTEAKTHF